MYGMGTASLAVSIKGTVQEAQEIIDSFYNEFPKVKAWIDKTQKDALKNGYVEDLWGRRRRLPDLLIPRYDVRYKDSNGQDFNPLLGCKGLYTSPENAIINKYKKQLSASKSWKETDSIKKSAEKEGVKIIDNSGFVSQAERQCVNARIQGSAATMTKKAMIAVYNDEELNRLGFRLLIPVHDELIGECPSENADEVSKRLSQLMIESAKGMCDTPMKCDAEITSRWYEGEYLSTLKEEYEEMIYNGKSVDDSIAQLYENHPESKIFNLKETFVN